MQIYKDKKSTEKYIIAGEVFDSMDAVVNYLVNDKGLTPASLEAYLQKHADKPTINKKQAIEVLRTAKNLSIKKASSLLD